MAQDDLPLLPTSVIGSYAIPSWLWTALDEIEAGRYGRTDVRETMDDACAMALIDQERAGVDVITDGEMRRWYFVQSFYGKMEGLERIGDLRKVGVYGYDSVPRYWPTERVVVPEGLGVVEEFEWTKAHTQKRLKATCPGPLTLTIHIQLRDKSIYKDRLEMAHEFAGVVNRELKRLVEAGAEWVQLDEPSYAVIPGTVDDWIELFNRSVEGVRAKIGLHVCFGNLASRPRGKRAYGWMFPELLEAKADQFCFEFANREMREIEVWKAEGDEREFAAGLVDVKSFYVETPEDVAERVRTTLQYVEAEKLWITPDCGFFQLPRWLAFLKLQNMVRGTEIVRRELAG
jgi:5-methyltetrahydropteroyltriglutamate--homocysteine methyltransferase